MKIGLVVIAALLLALAPVAGATDPTGKSPAEIRQFYESGDWNRAIVKQVKKAKAYLEARTEGKRAPKKPALVLDIDETSLDNYPCYVERGGIPYDSLINAQCVTAYDAPAIKPVRSLFKRAQALKVAVFFITGRPEGIRPGTLANLKQAGYTGQYKLILRSSKYEDDASVVPYKSEARQQIQKRGFKIIANVGDQQSDLKGGFSERTYKLPNPIYLTP